MSMRIYKVMSKETKAKLIFSGVLVGVVAIISVPYFVNLLHSSNSDSMAEIEIPKTESPAAESISEPESVAESEPTPEPDAANAEPTYEATGEAPRVYYTYTTAQPATSEQPAAASSAPAPEPESESIPQGNYIDSNEDDGYTPTGIDDPCIEACVEDSAYEQ